MQFKVLFRKNFIYWKRHYKTSIAEILIPLLLAVLIIFLRRLTTVTTSAEGSSPPVPVLTSIDNLNDIPTSILRKSMKNCDGRSGGCIGLAPSFGITQKLGLYFQKLNYTVHYFNSNDEIDAWVQDNTYLYASSDGSRNQLCLAVVFNSYNTLNYDYSLRFNLTGNPATIDHFTTESTTYREQFKIESLDQYQKLLTNGIITLQGLIDGLIFEQELNTNLDIQIEKMRNPQYTSADYTSALESPFIITLAAAGLVAFLRFISHIVNERECRNLENMENMGMSKFTYILSVYCFSLLIQFIIGILFTVIVKIGVFKSVHVVIIFLTYFMFILCLMTIGSVISSFFISTKKAIITGLIIFFILFLFWILKDTLTFSSELETLALAISPMGGLAQLVKNFIIHENSSTAFNFPELNHETNLFRGRTYFAILAIEIYVFFWIGVYFFYVIPLKIGIAKHPLFIFGYPWKKQENDDFDYRSYDEEKLLNDKSIAKENFEMVEEELKQQSRNNQTLSIQNLMKTFSKNKVAVNNLSLEMYRDQIFALLGHNGAGKTTTISMISGFLQKDKGTIQIMGYDLINDREKIKKIMGICPQTNPIFEYLTVQEHLEIYARIKGVSGSIQAEIDEILRDIDLLHKKNYLAGNLSGGQKRKLCVAIALIGKSKVILLDEPTSGMDTYARRHLWEMLKKYKKDRIIILTTHNMDEADYLGDRIGIMSSGKLVTCGSSLFLKKKFGDGYELVILKKANIQNEQIENIKELVSMLVPEATFLSEIGSELKYRLPQQSNQFHKLFKQFEDMADIYGIQSFGITLATLEDVFIKVANIQINDKHLATDSDSSDLNNKDNSKITLSNEDKFSKYYNIEDEIQDKDLQSLRVKNSARLFDMQMRALIKKRFIFFSRDISGIICEIFLPIVIILVGLALTKISFVHNLNALSISPNIYPDQNNFLINSLESGGTNTNELMLIYFSNSPSTATIINSENITSFDMTVYNNGNDKQLYAFYLDSISRMYTSYTVFCNTTAPFAPYVAVNSINNALLKLLSQNPNASIKMTLNPLQATKGIRSIEDTIDGFIVVMLISLGFAFIPSSLILFIIKEREKNAKHQQIISGVNLLAYWLSNFIVDYIKYLIPAMAIFGFFFLFDIKFFIGSVDKIIVSFLLLFLYGWAMIGYTYISSFLFKSPSSGQIFMFLFCFFTSFILIIVMSSLKFIPDTRDITQNVLDYIFRIIPSFSFPYGYLMMANASLFTLIFKWPLNLDSYDRRIALLDIIYIPVMAIITYLMVFLIEYWVVIFSHIKKSKVPSAIIKNLREVDQKRNDPIDNDVVSEEENIKNNTQNFAVKVTDLWKIFPLRSSSTKNGKSISHKAAVKGISFGVEQGMVFSLLGTNGAGKTTTFKILTGDTSASFGEANIMGFEMPKSLIQIRHLVGYCPQFDSILENLTAQEHLELYANLKGIDPKYHEVLIERMLDTMNLTKYRHVKAGTYSGGNKRKLNVAIALLGRPPIVFLDEPSSGMDPEARRFMWSVISDISTKRKHSSVILTTHSMEESEALSTKIAIMVEGKIKTIGSVQQLKNKFGKGFELDIKLTLPLELEIIETKQNLMTKLSLINSNEFTSAQIHQILESENLIELEKEIAASKRGSAIFQRLETNKYVESNLFIEWIIISKNLMTVESKIQKRFSAEVLECFQSYVKFKISENNKLSEIFKFMDAAKHELKIDTYSVRQISLEQIFIQFAQNIEHED